MALKKYHVSNNLLDYSTFANGYTLEISSGLPVPYGGREGRTATITPIDVSNISEVTFNYTSSISNTLFIYSLINGNTLVTRVAGNTVGTVIDVTSGDKLYLCFYSSIGADITTTDVYNAMLNVGSTALPYEPYGNTWNNIPYRRYENGEWVEYNVKKYENGQWG